MLAESDPLRALRLGAGRARHQAAGQVHRGVAWSRSSKTARSAARPPTRRIIGTILDRGYVFKKGTALVPSFLAFAVVNLLERHFGQLVDYAFTAQMEDALDEIARGEAERVPWLRRFYFGDGDGRATARRRTATSPRSDDSSGLGLKALVSDIGDIDPRDVSSFPLAGHRHRRPGRPVRAVPGAGRAAGQRARGHGARRADPGEGGRAVQRAERGQAARLRPGQRPRAGGQGRPVRAVRDRGAPRGRQGQAAHRLAAEVHDPGHRDARRRAAGCSACRAPSARSTASRSPCRTAGTAPTSSTAPRAGRWRPRKRCSPSPSTRPRRCSREPKARGRGPGRRRAAAARARQRPGDRQADGDQGRPVRPVRDRRRDQRVAAQGRRGGDHHRRSAAPSCSPTGGPPPRAARPARRRRRPATAKKAPRPRRRRPRRRRARGQASRRQEDANRAQKYRNLRKVPSDQAVVTRHAARYR